MVAFISEVIAHMSRNYSLFSCTFFIIHIHSSFSLSTIIHDHTRPRKSIVEIKLSVGALVIGGWDTVHRSGLLSTTLHTGIVKFLAGLPVNEPMVFELFGFMQEFFIDNDVALISGDVDSNNSKVSLLQYMGGGITTTSTVTPTITINSDEEKKLKLRCGPSGRRHPDDNLSRAIGTGDDYGNGDKSTAKRHRRRQGPREGSSFWTKAPRDTPKAERFPKVCGTIDRVRKSLPAARSRSEFLNLMKRAERGGRVLLVTGETGVSRVELLYFV